MDCGESKRKEPVRLVRRLERVLEAATRIALGLTTKEETVVKQSVEQWVTTRQAQGSAEPDDDT